jgi:hypothetical protein
MLSKKGEAYRLIGRTTKRLAKVKTSMINDKNSILGELNIRKTELNVKKKNHKIWGVFLRGLGDSLLRFRRLPRKDRAFTLCHLNIGSSPLPWGYQSSALI